MILNMQQDDTRKWIACVVASSDGVPSDKFNKMVDAPSWNDKAIDFRITMNGVEFTELDKRSKHLDDVYEKELDEELADVYVHPDIAASCTNILINRGEK